MNTIVEALHLRARVQGDAPAWRARVGGRWSTCSWREHIEQIRLAARGLIAAGMPVGAKVAIRGPNRPEWLTAAMATMMAGGVVVGVYRTASARQVRYVLDHSEAWLAIVESPSDRALVELEARPRLEKLVTMDTAGQPSSATWRGLVGAGERVPEAALEERLAALRPEQVASIVYTSGTTGAPKGVMLTHANLAWAAAAFARYGGVRASDTLVSYLPLAHIAEQLGSLYIPAVSGASIWLCDELKAMPEVLREAQPSILFGVPQVWQRVRTGVEQKLAGAPAHKRAVFNGAHELIGRATRARMLGGEPSALVRAGAWIADAKIMAPARAAMGLGGARWTLSGSGPIDRETLEFFLGLGLVLYEGYGLTETTAATVHNLPGSVQFGTVGRAVDGVEMRIAEDGEVLLRGPNVFAGYFKDEAKTGEVLREGWLHTGDLGTIDGEGFLSLTGRKSDMIVTAGGKNIAPVPIEQALEGASGIEHAVVVGEARPHLIALLWISEGAQPNIDAIVEGVNADFSRTERIRKYRVIPEPLSVDGGTLTPTLKVRRRDVIAQFADVIEQVYAS